MSESESKLIIEKENGVGRITIHNPKRHNAMTLDMWLQMPVAIKDFSQDETVRLVIITGSGERAFCAGADISQFEKNRSSEEAQQIYNEAVGAASLAIDNMEKPTLARVRGYCLGGGFGLALRCDLRIASEDATFAVPAAKLGIGYGMSGIKQLNDLVGPSFTKEVFYTARQFTALEAYNMGMINRVIPTAELDEYISDYEQRISGNAPLTIRATKLAVQELTQQDNPPDWKKAEQWVKDCFDSSDFVEGRRAFMEKRKPIFTGK